MSELKELMLGNLSGLSINLPDASTPGGNYVSVNVVGKIAYVAIQFPKIGDNFLFRGRLGLDLTTDDGYKAAQLSAINVLAAMNKYVGLENIYRLNHFDGYYQCAEDWDEGPKVINGASDLFVNVMGEAGKHSRAIFGVYSLPRNFSVGITASFTLV